jgi:hypothetical protein
MYASTRSSTHELRDPVAARAAATSASDGDRMKKRNSHPIYVALSGVAIRGLVLYSQSLGAAGHLNLTAGPLDCTWQCKPGLPVGPLAEHCQTTK